MCAAIAAGATIEEVCRRVGITSTTFYEWTAAKPDFSAKVDSAKEARLKVLEERWVNATKKDWRASQAMLAILKPDRWSPKIRLHVETQLDDVLDRLQAEFQDEPELYERVLRAVAGAPDALGTGSHSALVDGEATPVLDAPSEPVTP